MTASECQRSAQAGLAPLVAGWFPLAPPARLAVAVDFIHWCLALDDVADESLVGQRPSALGALLAQLLPVLEGRPPQSGASRFAVGLHDLLRRLSMFATASQIHSFCQASSASLGAMLWEADNRSSGRAPDESVYMLLRPTLGWVPALLELLCPVNGIELPQHEPTLSEVSALTRIAGRVVCWVNDVFSYEKERANGDAHNLVIVYERCNGLSSRAAMPRALDLVNQELDTFLAYTELLPELGLLGRELRRYVSCLETGIGGTLEWFAASPRYGRDSICSRSAALT